MYIRQNDQSGIAMIVAIIIVTLVIAFGAIALGVSNSSLGESSEHVEFEQAVHLAEQGIDQSLARLQQAKDFNDDYFTTTEVVTGNERTWARSRLQAATTGAACFDAPSANTACLADSPGGQFAVVKPKDKKVVYAGAWVPSKDDPKKFRMLKVDYLFSSYRPSQGILTGGNLRLQGGAGFSLSGGVHSNADVHQVGTSTVAGGLSASGSCTSSGPGTPTACAPSQPREDVPVVEPMQMWSRQRGNFPGAWYDLCPNGIARLPDGATPCDPAATLVYDRSVSGAASSHRGWSYSPGGPGSSSSWSKDGDASYSGIYYVWHSNVEIRRGTNGAQWAATVITDGELKPSEVCEKKNGDIDVAGSPSMVPFPGMSAQLVAGRDLQIIGNAGATFNGLLAAQEQISLSGTATIVGAVVAEDRCDTPSPDPLVHLNFFGGSLSLTYDGGLDVLLGGLIRTTLWLEL